MLSCGLCDCFFFGNCVIFHYSCIENFVHCPKPCCGELFVYVVKNIYKGLNVGFSLGCVDFFSFRVASCVPKLPLS